jgi:hypothetical protein
VKHKLPMTPTALRRLNELLASQFSMPMPGILP